MWGETMRDRTRDDADNHEGREEHGLRILKTAKAPQALETILEDLKLYPLFSKRRSEKTWMYNGSGCARTNMPQKLQPVST